MRTGCSYSIYLDGCLPAGEQLAKADQKNWRKPDKRLCQAVIFSFTGGSAFNVVVMYVYQVSIDRLTRSIHHIKRDYTSFT